MFSDALHRRQSVTIVRMYIYYARQTKPLSVEYNDVHALYIDGYDNPDLPRSILYALDTGGGLGCAVVFRFALIIRMIERVSGPWLFSLTAVTIVIR